MANILIATIGSLGDIHPKIAIALALQARGHKITFATSAHYHGRLTKLGFDAVNLRPDTIDPNDATQLAKFMDLQRGTEYLLRDYIFPAIEETYNDICALIESKKIDAIVTGELGYAVRLASITHNLPWASVTLSPGSFFSPYDMPVLPGVEVFSLLHRLGPSFNKILTAIGRARVAPWTAPYQKLCQKLGIPPQGNPIFEAKHSPYLVLAAFSEVMGQRQPDWPANTVLTGFPYHDSTPDLFDAAAAANQLKLQEFLAAGAPPLVFTLGSSAMFVPGRFYEESAAAARALNRRAILLMGQNALLADLPPTIMALDYLPYQDVFPHAAAIIHQGGVGTCAQALRFGKPTICVPYSHDQPDNAARLAKLGTSLTVPRVAYKADLVASKLATLLRPDGAFVVRATEAAEKMRGEDGDNACAKAIEKMLEAGLKKA